MRRIAALASAALLAGALALAGCSAPAPQEAPEPAADVVAQADALRIGSMKGPTSVGLASMMEQEQGDFTVVAAADELTALLLQDELDIALVPANVAATLYQRTDGQLRAIDVNTLGVLYGVSADASLDSVQALSGRTVYMTGQGSVPQYTFEALLAAAGMTTADVDLQFKSEPAEVVALLAQDREALGILPQPYATAATLKDDSLSQVLDLTEAWEEATGGDEGSIVTGVTVAKASTIEAMPEAIDLFLERHGASAAVAQDDPASIAAEVVSLGIIDSEAVATKAIPLCNVVCLTGSEMSQALEGYLEALFEQAPEAIGGALPGEDFYYLAS